MVWHWHTGLSTQGTKTGEHACVRACSAVSEAVAQAEERLASGLALQAAAQAQALQDCATRDEVLPLARFLQARGQRANMASLGMHALTHLHTTELMAQW